MKYYIVLLILFITPSVHAHTFTGMVGFYDGISHPVLGIDHFLAMVSVGVISAQIGGRAIWTVPTTFVSIMTIGGLFGFFFPADSQIFVVRNNSYDIILLLI